MNLNNDTPIDLHYFKKIILVLFFLIEGVALFFLAIDNIKFSLLPLIIIGLLFLLIYSFNNPQWFIYLFIFSILLGSINLLGQKEPIGITNLLLPLVVILFLVHLFFLDISSLKEFFYINVLYFLFLVWSLIVSLISVDSASAIAWWKNYFIGFLMFNYVLIVFNKKEGIKNYILLIVLWGLILSLIIFGILLSLGDLELSVVKLFLRKNLLYTSWGKSNYLATFFVLLIPISVGYYLYSKNLYIRWFLLFSIFLMSTALIMTFSRGGILSSFVALLMLLSYTLKRKNFIRLVGLMIAVSIILYLNPAVQLMLDSLSNINKSLSYFSRINFYLEVWNTFLENPITGVGFGNLGYYSKFLASTHASAHNIVLGLLGETGIVGAILFLSVIVLNFGSLIKKYIKEKDKNLKILRWSFLSSFTGVLIHSMMEPNIEGLQFSIIFWSTLAIFNKV
jgi:O-antigen ligase